MNMLTERTPAIPRQTPGYAPGACGPPAIDRFEARPVSVRLWPSVSVLYDVEVRPAGHPARQLEVLVRFPEEARALLECLSWSAGTSIVATLERIGASVLGQACSEIGRDGTCSVCAGAPAGRGEPLGVDACYEGFREALGRIVSLHGTAAPGPPREAAAEPRAAGAPRFAAEAGRVG